MRPRNRHICQPGLEWPHSDFGHPGAALATIDLLSTAQVPPAQRVAFWKDIFAVGNQSLQIETPAESFHGILTRLSAGALEIASVKSTPLLTYRPPSETKNFTLQVVHAGHCRLQHAGVDCLARTGDLIVVDASKPYELAFSRPLQGLVVSLPWERFGGHAKELEALAGRPLNLNTGPAAVLSSFIRTTWSQLVERSVADGGTGGECKDWPLSASDTIWQLLTSALQGERPTQSMHDRAEELRRRAAALVNERLAEPGFSSSAIADELDVSARYLQRVFAEAGTTPAQFLLACRLDAAAERLRHGGRHASITDVALECGFNDLSYFSRSFRRRFGVSARNYRLGPNRS